MPAPRPTARVVALVLSVLSALVAAAAPDLAGAADRPVFRLPFRCGERWHASTYPGHYSSGSAVDLNHESLDDGRERGRPVLASAAGTVVAAGYEVPVGEQGFSGFGNYVLLEHAGGWATLYAHLDHVAAGLSRGAVVARGTLLGGVGDTGHSDGVHLHYEQRRELLGAAVPARIDGAPLPWGVDVASRNCGGHAGPFPDVRPDTYYHDAVAWLHAEGLTTGVGDTGLFRPDRGLDRGQIATLLWRQARRPRVATASFPDVDPGAYYADAVAWMAREGLTTGVGRSGEYRPGLPVTRAQLVTLLWRLAGSPRGATPAGFVDTVDGAYYEAAVDWAGITGLTTGVGGSSRFAPGRAVTRAEAAVFLHRDARLRATASLYDRTPALAR